MSRRLRGADRLDRLRRNVVALGMHDVLGGVVLLHQAEGVDADLELDGLEAHALLLDALDELGREMQARGRSRSAMLLLHGVDGLVLLGIALVIGDIGRQRHVARSVDRLVERAQGAVGVLPDRLEAHQAPAAAIVDELEDGRAQHDRSPLGRQGAAGAVLDLGTGLQALARVHQALPHDPHRIDVLAAIQQQGLRRAARRLPADQARRHDTGLVRDQHVARLQVIDDIAEDAVVDGAVAAMEHEQAARIAGFGGRLGDQLIGQVVIKVIGTHLRSSQQIVLTSRRPMIARPRRRRRPVPLSSRNGYAEAASRAARRASRIRKRSSAASAAENLHPQ